MAGSRWTVEEHRGRTGFVRLESHWRRLYAELSVQTIFHSYDARLAHLDHLSVAGDDLRCLALSDGDRIRAICLLEPREQHGGRLCPKVWRQPSLLQGVATVDVLCADDEDVRRHLLPALIGHLRHEPAAILHLGPFPEYSPLWEGLRRRSPLGCYVCEAVERMHVLDCTSSFEATLSRLSNKTRTNLRKAARKLESLPDVRFETACAPNRLAEAYEAFIDLEVGGWKRESPWAVKTHPAWAAFHRTLTQLSTDLDRCEINMLHAAGRCIAAEFCLRTGGEYSALKIAYDESFAAFAPGLLLVHNTLQRCCDDPTISRLNWIADASWERRWHPKEITLWHGYVAVGGWFGLVLVALVRLRLGLGRRMDGWCPRLPGSRRSRSLTVRRRSEA